MPHLQMTLPFFRYQTKPPMTRMGDLYYENKENTSAMKLKRPGEMSQALREALGMAAADAEVLGVVVLVATVGEVGSCSHT